MATKRPELVYHYRGSIERGLRYKWRDGYSADGAQPGTVAYPWMTRRECQTDAKRAGCKAIFYRYGKREAD